MSQSDLGTAAPAGTGPFTPTFDRTLSRAPVHKAGPEAVWLTDLARLGDHHYICAGQVPRAHTYVNDAIPPLHTYYDLGLLTELGRQAGIAMMHEYEGAPVDWATVFMKFDLELVGPVANERTPGPVPATVEVTFHNREEKENSFSIFGTSTFAVDGVVRATAATLAAAYEKGPYKEWRREMRAEKTLTGHGPRAVEPIAPERVGRRDPANVMIGELQAGEEPGSYECPAVIDQLHPHFFEHPMDHIPGVAHLEILRQAALVAATAWHGVSPVGATITSCRTRFKGFAELELPVDCRIEVGTAEQTTDGATDVAVRLALVQPGDPSVTTARMIVRTLPA